jgi:hypothetical protein
VCPPDVDFPISNERPSAQSRGGLQGHVVSSTLLLEKAPAAKTRTPEAATMSPLSVRPPTALRLIILTGTLSVSTSCVIADPGGRITVTVAPAPLPDPTCIRRTVLATGYEGIGSLGDSGIGFVLEPGAGDHMGRIRVSASLIVRDSESARLAVSHSWIGTSSLRLSDEMEVEHRLTVLLKELQAGCGIDSTAPVACTYEGKATRSCRTAT